MMYFHYIYKYYYGFGTLTDGSYHFNLDDSFLNPYFMLGILLEIIVEHIMSYLLFFA